MSTPTSDEPVKSKKPSNSAFKQQRLKAWQPILTAGTVLPMFFGVGIAFIPIGIGLLISSNMVQEHIIDYTDCQSDNPQISGEKCADVIKDNINSNCSCTINFTLTDALKGDVYMYYGLKNFYQNHRRYVKSRDDSQLLGISGSKMTDCDPFAYADPNNLSTPIAPCGAIANSLFNDTIKLYLEGSEVYVLNTGIAWPTDKNVKFKNPSGSSLEDAFAKTYKPINWNKPVYMLDPSNPENNGYLNEDFIVWMRTAALPSFRKLYRRVDHSQPRFKSQMPPGEYQFKINYYYPVTQFGGNKTVILSTTSWLGGKNPFLGIAYIVVGCICLVLGFVFLVIHIKFGKSTHDMVNITSRTTF